MAGQDNILPLSNQLARPRAGTHRGSIPERDRWWDNLPNHAPKVNAEKKDVLGEIMRMKVKDGDIIILRVPRNFSRQAIEHHIKSIRNMLKERGISASVTAVLKEVDLLVMSKEEGENVLGVNMKIE